MAKLAIIVNWVVIGLFVVSALLLTIMGKMPNIWIIALALMPYAAGLAGLHRKTAVFWKVAVIALSVFFCLLILLFSNDGKKAVTSGSSLLYKMMYLVPILLNITALILQIGAIKFRKKAIPA